MKKLLVLILAAVCATSASGQAAKQRCRGLGATGQGHHHYPGRLGHSAHL